MITPKFLSERQTPLNQVVDASPSIWRRSVIRQENSLTGICRKQVINSFVAQIGPLTGRLCAVIKTDHLEMKELGRHFIAFLAKPRILYNIEIAADNITG